MQINNEHRKQLLLQQLQCFRTEFYFCVYLLGKEQSIHEWYYEWSTLYTIHINKDFLKSGVVREQQGLLCEGGRAGARVTPRQTMSSSTDTILDYSSREAGQDGHSSGSCQQSSENEMTVRWRVRSKVKSTPEIQATSAGDKAQIHLKKQLSNNCRLSWNGTPRLMCRVWVRVPGEAGQGYKRLLVPSGPWHREPLFIFLFFKLSTLLLGYTYNIITFLVFWQICAAGLFKHLKFLLTWVYSFQ